MTTLTGLPLDAHLKIIENEIKFNKTLYGYPAKNFFRGYLDMDTGITVFGKKAYTPVGPAAGPHTQLAQNIIIAFLSGARYFELKTIQINDRLVIPRPCIDMRNIGYNVEWSQELLLKDSLREYIKAWLILHYLKETDLFSVGNEHPFYDFIFDVSLGYDLPGVTSSPIRKWLEHIRNPGEIITELISPLAARHKDLLSKLPAQPISESITLSTFHGCPPTQIEQMAQYLMVKEGFNVIIKFNPTLLGYERVETMLHGEFGYENIALEREDFERDLSFEDALNMTGRLQRTAQSCGRELGVKFTNTLVVKNTEKIFTDRKRYLSGPPLFPIALEALQKFRVALIDPPPMSFSGGLTKENIAAVLAADIRPLTLCTDLLKKGGYSRIPKYLNAIRDAMLTAEVTNISDFIRHTNQGENPSYKYYKQLLSDQDLRKQYGYSINCVLPKTIAHKLKQLDCINCDICTKVCPNLAIFSFQFQSTSMTGSSLDINQQIVVAKDSESILFDKPKQIMIIRDFCNACGNCATFCPEYGDPQGVKLNLFLSRECFEEDEDQNGFFLMSPHYLIYRNNRIKSEIYRQNENRFIWQTEEGKFVFDNQNHLISGAIRSGISEKKTKSVRPFLLGRMLLQSIPENMRLYPMVSIQNWDISNPL